MSPGAFLALLPLLAGDPPGPAAVPLKFAWPSPLRCAVEHETGVRYTEGVAPTGNVVRLSLEARRSRDGWHIRHKVLGQTATGPPPEGVALPARKRPMDPRETELLLYPPFRVAHDGAFAGVELTAADQATLEKRQASEDKVRETVRKLVPSAPAMPREDVMASAKQRASSNWSFLVAAWAGKELPPGDNPALRSERDENLPLIGAIHVVDRMRLTAGAPCKPSPRGGCVKLEVTSAPESDVRYRLTTTLITDPRTLIPRSLTRVTDVEMPDPDAASPGSPSTSTPTKRRRTEVVETMTFRCK